MNNWMEMTAAEAGAAASDEYLDVMQLSHVAVTSLSHLYCARDLRGKRRVDDDERFSRQRAVRQAVASTVWTDSPTQLRQTADRLDRLVCADLQHTVSN